MTKISQLSSIGDSLAIGDQFLIRDIDDAGSPNKSVTVSGITRALADGDATAPALAFAADKNTGIYRAGTDSLAVATNGTGRLFIDASGNIGVGVSSPQHPVHIDGTSGSVQFRAGVTYAGTGLDIKATENTDVTIDVNDSTKTVARALVVSQAGSERLRITSAGLVGIGTSSPGELLDVVGNIRQTGNTAGTGNTVGLIDFYNANNTTTVARVNVRTDGAANSGSYRISTANAGTLNEVVRITSGGLVGIGTTSPGSALEINAAAATSPFIAKINTAEAARIDSSGRLLVGTSSARSTATAGTGYQTLIESPSDYAALTLFANKNNNQGSYIGLGKSRGTTAGAVNLVSSGDILGYIGFEGTDGTAPRLAASIEGQVDGTPGANDMPGRLVFSTTADGAATPTERMRIRNDGQVLIGATANAKSGKLEVTGRLAVLNGKETIQTGSAAYTAATTATEVLEFDNFGAGSGFFGAELFVTFVDNASTPAGTIVQKVYVVARGSGANVTHVAASQSDILLLNNSASFTGYLTWTVAVVSNRARLSVTATAASGDGVLTVHCNGSPFTFLI